jgi:hypothetical protein
MRGGRSFVILIALALGLGGYIYFVEMKREPSGALATKDKVFTLESDTIEALEVRAASGETTTLKKTGADWQITAPEALEADATAVSTITTALVALENQRTVDESPASVKDFGLDPARISVSFRPAGETAMQKLNVGNKTPTGSDLYARVEGQAKVFLISGYLEDSFNRTPFQLRDKSVLEFTKDNVDSLKVETADAPAVAFARKADVWRLTVPVDAKADFNAVDGMVSQISQAQMKEIVSATEPPAADLRKYGLDKPQATVTIGQGSTRATLAVGGKKEGDEGSLYARDLSRPAVFTVDSSLLDGLKKKPEDVRVKDVFEFRTFTAVGADFTYGGETYSFKKEKPAPPKDAPADAPPPAEVWKQLKPAAKDADQTKMTDLLTTVSNLRAEKFADKALTSGQELTIVARFGDAASPQEERVTFRKSGDVVHAIRAGEGGAAVVSTADFDKAVTTLKELAGIK